MGFFTEYVKGSLYGGGSGWGGYFGSEDRLERKLAEQKKSLLATHGNQYSSTATPLPSSKVTRRTETVVLCLAMMASVIYGAFEGSHEQNLWFGLAAATMLFVLAAPICALLLMPFWVFDWLNSKIFSR